MKMKIKLIRLLATACLTFLLVSCANSPEKKSTAGQTDVSSGALDEYIYERPRVSSFPDYSDKKESDESVQNEVKPFISKGSGKFIQTERARRKDDQNGKGEITLNFEAVDLREVIKIIFEEILNKNYLIDPAVQGVVTIHTTKPVSTDDVLPIFESILELNQAALVREGMLYKIVPLAKARKMLGTPAVGGIGKKRSPGHGVQVVPLQYVAASEMLKILYTISDDKENIKSDDARNLILLSGPSSTTNHMIDTIKMFDVDWLRGMSFALFPLQHTDAKTMVDDLKNIVGESGPLAGIVRLIPIERLNAVLVISHQPRYIAETKKLIEQFDLGIDKAPGRRLYVYRLENGKAENIAEILQQIFGQETGGEEPSAIASKESRKLSNIRSPERSSIQSKTAGSSKAGDYSAAKPASPAAAPKRASSEGRSENRFPVTIIADTDNNSILILASSQDYKKIQSTIHRLDVAPRQVLIEATIAEVQLSNNLSYGIRWFLEGGSRTHPIDIGLDVPLPTGIGGAGFSLGIFNSSDQLRLLFDLLESESSVKFLSAPHIMVVDNQTATFRVGDQIPINTRTTQSTIGADSPIVSEFQYRDTGTLLQVTPRINAGGMITLEINQEVSNPGPAPIGENPPIAQRTIDTTVIVHSGQSIVLGGLIRENLLTSQDGIPVLMDIPVLGNLFSSTSENVSRTELMITLTPRVMTNPNEVYELSKELRSKLKEAAEIETIYRN